MKFRGKPGPELVSIVCLRVEIFMTEQETVFDKIINRDIPADILYEDDDVLAFRDINPQTPTHFLVIPKRRIAMLAESTSDDESILGKLLATARDVAVKTGIADSGYRVVINNGEDGGMEVAHLHLHVLGGRRLLWPPG